MNGDLVTLVAVSCIFGGPMIVWAISAGVGAWTKVAKHREDTDLKHKLVDAGFSTEEIVRVMNAGRGKSKKETKEDDALAETHVKVG